MKSLTSPGRRAAASALIVMSPLLGVASVVASAGFAHAGASLSAPPDAIDDEYSMRSDEVVGLGILSNDVPGLDDSGNPAPFDVPTIIVPVAEGETIVNFDGSVTYIPAADSSGSASFTYQVCNLATTLCDQANVAITIRVITTTTTSPPTTTPPPSTSPPPTDTTAAVGGETLPRTGPARTGMLVVGLACATLGLGFVGLARRRGAGA